MNDMKNFYQVWIFWSISKYFDSFQIITERDTPTELHCLLSRNYRY